MFNRSPETTAAGVLALLGFLVFVAGSLLKSSEAVTAGLGIVALAVPILAALARSEAQHERDKPALKAEVAKDVKEEVREEARDVARVEVQQTVRELKTEGRPDGSA